MDKICAVFIANNSFISEFKKSAQQLLNNGLFRGDIVLIIGDDLNEDVIISDSFFIDNKIEIVKFKNIEFSNNTRNSLESVKTDGRNITKKFQWHKLHIFNVFFKKWDYVFYLDCGMKIHQDVSPILNLRKENSIVAQSDNIPDNGWNLGVQFDKTNPLFQSLNENFNLGIDYFQSGLMLFDSNLITDTLFDEFIKLVDEYPITKTNEQSYIALYFTNIKKVWCATPLGDEEKYYYHPFRIGKDKNYIITKYE